MKTVITREEYALIQMLADLAWELRDVQKEIERCIESYVDDDYLMQLQKKCLVASSKVDVFVNLLDDRETAKKLRNSRQLGAKATNEKRRKEAVERVAHVKKLVNSGESKTSAVEMTAAKFDVDSATVWRNLRQTTNKR